MCITDRQLLRDFIYSLASKASKLPQLTKPILIHEGGDGDGIRIVTRKNRLYLRKKSFFARFFAHRTRREEIQRDVNDGLKKKRCERIKKIKIGQPLFAQNPCRSSNIQRIFTLGNYTVFQSLKKKISSTPRVCDIMSSSILCIVCTKNTNRCKCISPLTHHHSATKSDECIISFLAAYIAALCFLKFSLRHIAHPASNITSSLLILF